MALVKITCTQVEPYMDLSSIVREWIAQEIEAKEHMAMTITATEYMGQTLTVEDSI